jgi:hypothetical protein
MTFICIKNICIIISGKITAGIGALKFGPCLDDFSMPKHDGFTGFISEVNITLLKAEFSDNFYIDMTLQYLRNTEKIFYFPVLP